MLDALRYLSIGLPAVLLCRLVQQRLWRVSPYSGFGIFLCVGLARDLFLLTPDYSSHTFAVFWEYTLPVLLVAQCVAGVSAYVAIARLYPKIGMFAVWLFVACLAAASAFGVLLLPMEIKRIGAEEATLRVLFLVQRWIATLLAGGLVLAVIFLARYPSPLKRLPRNLVVHTACLSAYFSTYAALYTLENLSPLGEVIWAEWLQLAAVICIYAWWTWNLSQAGEQRKAWTESDLSNGPGRPAGDADAASRRYQTAGGPGK